jgi:hypothetical protein
MSARSLKPDPDPSRHGRVADALISSYVRELLADEAPNEVESDAHAPAEPPIVSSAREDSAIA